VISERHILGLSRRGSRVGIPSAAGVINCTSHEASLLPAWVSNIEFWTLVSGILAEQIQLVISIVDADFDLVRHAAPSIGKGAAMTEGSYSVMDNAP
jgi:hypothetical protein